MHAVLGAIFYVQAIDIHSRNKVSAKYWVTIYAGEEGSEEDIVVGVATYATLL